MDSTMGTIAIATQGHVNTALNKFKRQLVVEQPLPVNRA